VICKIDIYEPHEDAAEREHIEEEGEI